jgi:GWxTD domain-containing protein
VNQKINVMKKIYRLPIIMLAMLLSIGVQAKDLQAYLLYSTFFSPKDGPYIETYLSVVGESVVYEQLESGKFQGTIEITMMFKENDAILNFAKYELKSPELDDTTNITTNFLDIQRFALPNGNYSYDLIISDKNLNKKPVVVTQKVNIDYPADQPKMSGFQLLDKYEKSNEAKSNTKNGLDLTPLVSNFYPEHISTLSFYNELYNMDKKLGKGESFVIKTYIKSFESGSVLKEYGKVKRYKATEVVPVINSLNIENLPNGNFNLVMEVIDKNNNIVTSSSMFFQRSNPNAKISEEYYESIAASGTFADKIPTLDSLKLAVRSLEPISDDIEKNFILPHLKDEDDKLLRRYFYNFWEKRYGVNAEVEWEKYAEKVRQVNEAFGTGFKYGFESDRGRIYLLNGAPNTIDQIINDPRAYPFEIWHYYQLGKQRNRKFVFMAHDAATNNFELLHSNAIGYVQNPKWKIELMGRYMGHGEVDAMETPDYYGENINRLWNNLR